MHIYTYTYTSCQNTLFNNCITIYTTFNLLIYIVCIFSKSYFRQLNFNLIIIFQYFPSRSSTWGGDNLAVQSDFTHGLTSGLKESLAPSSGDFEEMHQVMFLFLLLTSHVYTVSYKFLPCKSLGVKLSVSDFLFLRWRCLLVQTTTACSFIYIRRTPQKSHALNNTHSDGESKVEIFPLLSRFSLMN